MRTIDTIVIHQSDSAFGNASQIDEWHKQRGWSGIGYHRVVLNGCVRPAFYLVAHDGLIQEGRALEQVGAHVAGHNAHSLGICLIGQGDGLPINAAPSHPQVPRPGNPPAGYITAAQWESVLALCGKWLLQFRLGVKAVVGHREFPGVAKSCPGFDVSALRAALAKRTP